MGKKQENAPANQNDGSDEFLTEEQMAELGYKKPSMHQPPKVEDSDSEEEEEEEQEKVGEQKKSSDKPYFKGPKRNERKEGDNRPRIPVYENGKELRRKRAVDIGLSEKILPPLTKNVTATYRWLSANKVDPATKQIAGDKDVELPGSYMFFDKFEADPLKKKKPMYNYGRPKIEYGPTGERKVVDTIEAIEFIAGVKRVDVNKDYRLYVFMELHPLNGSNQYRDNNNPPLFERVDIKNMKSPAEVAAEMDLAHEAEAEIMQIKSKDKIIGLAVSAGVYQTGMGVGEAKNELRAFARKDPRKFFRIVENIRPAIKLNVLTAMTFGILEYKDEQKTFYFAETDEKVFTHLLEEDPYDSLTEYLAKKENANMLEQLNGLVDYWAVKK